MNLDPDEKELLESFERGEWRSVHEADRPQSASVQGEQSEATGPTSKAYGTHTSAPKPDSNK